MSLALYKVLHVLGVAATVAAIAGLSMRAAAGSNDEGSRKLAGMTHGLALILVLFTGFGALAKLGMSGSLPLWVWAKLGLWLFMGGMIVLIRKMPHLAKLWWFAAPLLAGLGAYLALYKPT